MRAESRLRFACACWMGALVSACTASTPTIAACNAGAACPNGHGPTTTATAHPAGTPVEASFMGDARHTGRSRFAGPRSEPSVHFRVQTGGHVRAAPVIDREGHVLVASRDGLLRLLSRDGLVLQTFDAGAPVSATPVIAADGSYWVGTESGLLLVIPPGGPPRPLQQLGAPIYAPLNLAPDGTVIVAADGVYGFRPNMTQRFHHVTADRLHSGPVVHPNGLLIFGTLHGRVRAIDLEGALRWEMHPGAAIEAAPTVADDGTIVVGDLLGRILGYGPDGSERFVVTPEGEHAVLASVALTASGGFVVGRADGSVLILDRSGTVLRSLTTAGAIRAAARVDAAGTIFVGSQDDTFLAFSDDGTVRWRYNLGQDIDAPAALGADGTLYVGTSHGAVYALQDAP